MSIRAELQAIQSQLHEWANCRRSVDFVSTLKTRPYG